MAEGLGLRALPAAVVGLMAVGAGMARLAIFGAVTAEVFQAKV